MFEGWPHHGRTLSIYLCPLSFWLTLPRGVLSTSWCCPSRPCVVFLVCVHLSLFLALSFVSSWRDHDMLSSWLWRRLAVPSLLQLRIKSDVFLVVQETRRIFLSPFISKASRRVVYAKFSSTATARLFLLGYSRRIYCKLYIRSVF